MLGLHPAYEHKLLGYFPQGGALKCPPVNAAAEFPNAHRGQPSIHVNPDHKHMSNVDLTDKHSILLYLRLRARESIGLIERKFSQTEYRQRAAEANRQVHAAAGDLKTIAIQRAKINNWSPQTLLDSLLKISYSSYVVMIERRNSYWPYEYMTFSRRIGELWEPFCKTAFDYPANPDLHLITPPLFSDVRDTLQQEMLSYIRNLPLSASEIETLEDYYRKTWLLVSSGEIKLELDVHFTLKETDCHVDFKSGFQSNEKGNTNRLLLVATIYRQLVSGENRCILLVRSDRELNNNYLRTLARSGLWDVHHGEDAYAQIASYTNFDFVDWIQQNIAWSEDFDAATINHLRVNDLEKYLKW